MLKIQEPSKVSKARRPRKGNGRPQGAVEYVEDPKYVEGVEGADLPARAAQQDALEVAPRDGVPPGTHRVTECRRAQNTKTTTQTSEHF